MTLTMTDLFCGAGGSSSGAVQVPGVQVRMASNHWRLAVDTHNANHPDTDHDCADLSQVDPRRYPRTDLLWASPECTNHSQAKGRRRNADATPDLFGESLPDEAAERSRATMWDVVRFAEHHRYTAIVVENVVDAARWVLWPAWRSSLDALGYCVHVVYLNSMHAAASGLPAPQSRDRLYVVAHQRTTSCPDLDQWTRPQTWCPECGETVRAVQAWKNPAKQWGRYRSQYVWRCPHVTCRNAVVEPGWLPAAAAIDWTLPGERIGDRVKPLAAKTLQRIAAGLARYSRPVHLEAGGNQYDAADPKHPQYGRSGGYLRVWDTSEPLRTLHATATKALAYGADMSPLLVPVEGRDGKSPATVADPLRTMTTRNETALVVPLRNNNTTKTTGDPFDTFAAAGNHHGLLMPYYGHATTRTTGAPHGTLTTRDRYALVMRNNSSKRSGAEMCTPVGEPLRTVTTAGHQSVLEYATPAVEDCLFRMLEPHEVAAGMAFESGYVVLGNKREKVRQLGNAVTPPAARDLIAAVAASLGHGPEDERDAA